MTHPLTDEIIRKNFTPDYDYFEGLEGEICLGFSDDDLRSAADWQLEQVVEWLKDELYYRSDIDPNLLSDLKKAMRPQEDNT